MKVIIKRLWNEPAFLGGVLIATVGLVVGHGTDLEGGMVGNITAFIALLTGVGVRQVVSPTHGATPEESRRRAKRANPSTE